MHNKPIQLITLTTLFCALLACNSGSSSSASKKNTDDGGDTTTIAGASNLSDHFATVASALVPLVSSSSSTSISSPQKSLRQQASVIFKDNSDFDLLLGEQYIYTLSDVFGSADEQPAPVTRIRVLLDEFSGTLNQLVSTDENFDCTNTHALTDSDTITVAFLGALDNGSADNRNFNCYLSTTDEADGGTMTDTLVYGQNADGIIRVVEMSTWEGPNTESPETRGDSRRIQQVVYSTSKETTNTDNAVVDLDLQYAQATIYSGVDGDLSTNTDNVEFKSRSRISGEVTLDSDNNVTDSNGDFSVIKYDHGVNEDLSTYENYTQTMGRGDYLTGGFSLFAIDSSESALESVAGTYCLEQATATLPAPSDSTNCTALETSVPWDSTAFPWSLTPTISDNFDEKTFYTTEDLISSDGSDFTIPTYQ